MGQFSRREPLSFSFALLAAVLVVPPLASAQILSNPLGNANLNAVMSSSLSVTVTGGSNVGFTLTSGVPNPGDTPVSIQTSWNLNPGLVGNVGVVGFFDVPSQALTDGTNNIASSLVEGRVSSATGCTSSVSSFTAFTQTVAGIGVAGGSLELCSQAITGANKNATADLALELQINLTGQTLTPSTYSGILRIQALAQ